MGKGSLGQPHHKQHQEKGKNIIIDQEGFQQVRSQKNTRQNIFGSNQDMGQGKVWKGQQTTIHMQTKLRLPPQHMTMQERGNN